MRRTPMKVRPPVDHSKEPGYREWKASTVGPCALCRVRCRLERHHVIHEQHVRAEHDDPYDLRNALQLGCGTHCDCHRAHTHATRRLPRSIIPPGAVQFAVELLGEARAEAYLSRYYSV